MVAAIHLITIETVIKRLDMTGLCDLAGGSEGSSRKSFIDRFMNKLVSNQWEHSVEFLWKADVLDWSDGFNGEGVKFGVKLDCDLFQ